MCVCVRNTYVTEKQGTIPMVFRWREEWKLERVCIGRGGGGGGGGSQRENYGK